VHDATETIAAQDTSAPRFVEHYTANVPHRAAGSRAALFDTFAGSAGENWGDARVLRRDRLGGVVHEYVLAA